MSEVRNALDPLVQTDCWLPIDPIIRLSIWKNALFYLSSSLIFIYLLVCFSIREDTRCDEINHSEKIKNSNRAAWILWRVAPLRSRKNTRQGKFGESYNFLFRLINLLCNRAENVCYYDQQQQIKYPEARLYTLVATFAL